MLQTLERVGYNFLNTSNKIAIYLVSPISILNIMSIKYFSELNKDKDQEVIVSLRPPQYANNHGTQHELIWSDKDKG